MVEVLEESQDPHSLLSLVTRHANMTFLTSVLDWVAFMNIIGFVVVVLGSEGGSSFLGHGRGFCGFSTVSVLSLINVHVLVSPSCRGL